MDPASIASGDPPFAFHPASSPDYVPREVLRGLQSQRLRQAVVGVYDHVPFYRQRMQKQGVTPADIRSVDDIAMLPLTLRSELADAYPSGMFAVPVQQLARLCPCGGRAGKTTLVGCTMRDLEVWTEIGVRCLASCGIQAGDIVQNVCGHDLLAEGLGLPYGAERLGATVVPMPSGEVHRQIMVLKDVGVSAIFSTADSFLHLAQRADEMHVNLRELPLRVGIFVGQTWSDALRQRIQQSAGIRAYQIYGLSEAIGPGVGAECCCQDGPHVFEDHFYPEIVDPASGAPLPEGQVGELLLTTLARQAMPILRYRTRELAAIVPEPCRCGRTMRRIRPSGRRSDEIVVLGGVGVRPAQIEDVLLAVEGTLPRYQTVLTRHDGLDRMEVQIEVSPQIISDRVGTLQSRQSRFAHELAKTLGACVAVRLVEPRSIEHSEDQGGRVIDRRLRT